MDAQVVADAFGLGRAESLSEPVARGELGQVRRLVTQTGAWAVKESLVGLDAEESAELERSGTFHLDCWAAGIPTPEPMTVAQLLHIGHRHLRMRLCARDSESRRARWPVWRSSRASRACSRTSTRLWGR